MSTMTVYEQDGSRIVRVQGEGVLLRDTGDALGLLGDASHHHDCHKLLLEVQNIDPSFFELRSGLAGELLQKFTNYGVKLAIVGDISPHTASSRALRDFVRECNRGNQIVFTPTLEEGLAALHRL